MDGRMAQHRPTPTRPLPALTLPDKANHATIIKFYAAVLAPLGATQLAAMPNSLTAFGTKAPQYWVAPINITPNLSAHIAFGVQACEAKMGEKLGQGTWLPPSAN